ncbi:hypothetical protein E3N88_18968 [Mikania micrantha]|uniref:Uncharacterized protein n=1 Tax=Mikania micrantha TaxID=192012 RepID=A0A5N6NLX5_9ASTR|nr:hypothetical protein E3N88_18968 [Mikania micrantha]
MLAGNKHVILVQKIKKLSSRLDKDGPEDKEKQKLDFLCPSRIARPSRNPVALRDRDDLGGDKRREDEIRVDLDHWEALDE